MTSYGLGIKRAQDIKEDREKFYKSDRPQVFEKLEQHDLVTLVKLKALRVEAFFYKLQEENTLDTKNNLADEIVDAINYLDMLYCKMVKENE